jgi:protein-S-isoprenylcysteine O-methyltransferase Ste14
MAHPLYASLALFGWGVFLKGADAFSAILAAIATAFLVVAARAEENFNIARLGSAYSDYRRETKMFIPYVI